MEISAQVQQLNPSIPRDIKCSMPLACAWLQPARCNYPSHRRSHAQAFGHQRRPKRTASVWSMTPSRKENEHVIVSYIYIYYTYINYTMFYSFHVLLGRSGKAKTLARIKWATATSETSAAGSLGYRPGLWSVWCICRSRPPPNTKRSPWELHSVCPAASGLSHFHQLQDPNLGALRGVWVSMSITPFNPSVTGDENLKKNLPKGKGTNTNML